MSDKIKEIAKQIEEEYPILLGVSEDVVVRALELALVKYKPDRNKQSRYNILIEAYESFTADIPYQKVEQEIIDSFYFLSGYFGVDLKSF